IGVDDHLSPGTSITDARRHLVIEHTATPSRPRCPFHKYTASACGLASFPQKRESRRRAPWGLDARLRGHDVLLAPDLRHRHLASLLLTRCLFRKSCTSALPWERHGVGRCPKVRRMS